MKFSMINDIEIYNDFKLRDYQVKSIKKMIKSKNGLAVEIPTGMGKSAIITAVAKLKEEISSNENVFLIYSNDSLALRDYIKYSKLYNNCNIIHDKFGFNINKQGTVIFTSITNLAFNFLAGNIQERELNTCIIDEVDLVLIDHATNFFSISDGVADCQIHASILEVTLGFYKTLNVKRCKELDPTVKYNSNLVVIDTVGRIFIGDEVIDNYSLLIENLGYHHKDDIISLLSTFISALRMEKYVDYTVINGKIVPIDKTLCRLSEGSRYSLIEQNILEYREGLELTCSSSLERSISTQHLVHKFRNIYGLSATITKDIRKELYSVFGIRTWKPKIKRPDIKFTRKVVQTRNDIIPELIKIIKDRENHPVLLILQDNLLLQGLKDVIDRNFIKTRTVRYITLDTTVEEELNVICGIKNNDLIISTKMIGRGTDILATYMTLIVTGIYQERDILQIAGRTARNGNKGEVVHIYSSVDYEQMVPYMGKINRIQKEIRLNNLRFSIFEEIVRNSLIRYTSKHNRHVDTDLVDSTVRLVLHDYKVVLSMLFQRYVSSNGASEEAFTLATKLNEIEHVVLEQVNNFERGICNE